MLSKISVNKGFCNSHDRFAKRVKVLYKKKSARTYTGHSQKRPSLAAKYKITLWRLKQYRAGPESVLFLWP